jgi:hypothetical protein
MSKNKSHTNGHKKVIDPKEGLWVKRDADSGKFCDPKEAPKPFKGVRKEALDKLGSTLNKLAKYDKK